VVTRVASLTDRGTQLKDTRFLIIERHAIFKISLCSLGAKIQNKTEWKTRTQASLKAKEKKTEKRNGKRWWYQKNSST